MAKSHKTLAPPESHIPTPFKQGNTITKEYFTEHLTSTGLMQMTTYVEYTNKKGELQEPYIIRVKFFGTGLTHLTTSDLNVMCTEEIYYAIMDYVLTDKDSFNQVYFNFLSNYHSRRMIQDRLGKKYYEQV